MYLPVKRPSHLQLTWFIKHSKYPDMYLTNNRKQYGTKGPRGLEV